MMEEYSPFASMEVEYSSRQMSTTLITVAVIVIFAYISYLLLSEKNQDHDPSSKHQPRTTD